MVLSLRLVHGYLVDFGMQNKIGCTKFNIIIISVYGKKKRSYQSSDKGRKLVYTYMIYFDI